jgi:hypothetical protein
MIESLKTLDQADRMQIQSVYDEAIQNLHLDIYKLNNDIRKKCNVETLSPWNDLIKQELGVDNFVLFGIMADINN